MRSRGPVLALVSVAGAVGFGLVVGPDWPLDAVSITVLCGVLVYLMAPKFDPFSLLGNVMARRMTLLSGRVPVLMRSTVEERGDRPPTSRIVHYVRISKMSDSKFTLSQAEGPFEKSLLGKERWQALSESQLIEIAREVGAKPDPVQVAAPTLS